MKWAKSSKTLLMVSLWLVAGLSVLPTSLASASTTYSKNPSPLSGWPASIASTGDSITRAYNTGSSGFTDAPANSWSTGTNTSVNSHYTRILAAFPDISGHSFNDAVSGAKMTDLNGQMINVNSQNVEYVTVLMGANDACASTEAAMTPIATFRAQFQAALNTLSSGSPDARVYVMSVPDIYNLWNVLHDNGSARFIWGLGSICQSMLANPQSTAQADIDRRNRVRQRVVDYNIQLAEVCASYLHCRFDNNTVFNTQFLTTDVSTRDYFHPSISGQARLAAATYEAGFDFTDNIPPSALVLSNREPPRTLSFVGIDNVGARGVEYKVDNGPYIRYTKSITLDPATTLTFRAVDVNGNVGPLQTVAP